MLDTLAYRLLDVPAINLCGMGWINHLTLVLGRRFLLATAQEGMLSWRGSCALAFKWIRILYKAWKTRTPYDEAIYLDALKKHASPLIGPTVETVNTA